MRSSVFWKGRFPSGVACKVGLSVTGVFRFPDYQISSAFKIGVMGSKAWIQRPQFSSRVVKRVLYP